MTWNQVRKFNLRIKSYSKLFKTLQKSLPHSLSLIFLNIKADLVRSLLCLCLCHPIKFNTSEILRKSKSIASKCFIILIIKFNVTTMNWRNNNISDAIIYKRKKKPEAWVQKICLIPLWLCSYPISDLRLQPNHHLAPLCCHMLSQFRQTLLLYPELTWVSLPSTVCKV